MQRRQSMKIDREKFFVLVAALAAGCRGLGEPAQPREPPEEHVPWSPAEPTDMHYGTGAHARPAPQHEGGHAVPGAANATDGREEGGPDPYAENVVGEHCNPWLNMHGFPRSCGGLKAPGPTCEGFDYTKDECAGMQRHLVPRVAAKAIDCVLAKSGSDDLCGSNVTAICAYQALASACVEPEATPVCAQLVTDCARDPTTHVAQAACEAAWSALRKEDRPKFIACMTESCHFGSCLP
jgi:hypothetical protein